MKIDIEGLAGLAALLLAFFLAGLEWDIERYKQAESQVAHYELATIGRYERGTTHE